MLTKFIESNIEEKNGATIRCATIESVPEYLDSFGGAPPVTEKMVGSRTIKVKRKVLSPEEQAKKHKAIAEVLAKSGGKPKKPEGWGPCCSRRDANSVEIRRNHCGV